MIRSRRLRAALMVLLLGGALGALPAQPSRASDAKWKVGSAVSTALYAPAKAVYASLAVVFGGIGWGLSGGNDEVLDAVITPALGGDYVVTPAHLRGERRLEFVGREEPSDPLAEAEAEDPFAAYWDEEASDFAPAAID